jgi:hypothetical protein
VSGCDDGGSDPGDASLDAHHDAGHETFPSLVVDPPTAMLTVVDDMPTTQQFQVFGVRANGTRVLLSGANWSVSNSAEGFIEATGLFTANGTAGGVVTVRATVLNGTMGNVSATATLTVRVERTVENGAPPGAATHFAGTPVTDPARAPRLAYPLDGAAMPSPRTCPTPTRCSTTTGCRARTAGRASRRATRRSRRRSPSTAGTRP